MDAETSEFQFTLEELLTVELGRLILTGQEMKIPHAVEMKRRDLAEAIFQQQENHPLPIELLRIRINEMKLRNEELMRKKELAIEAKVDRATMIKRPGIGRGGIEGPRKARAAGSVARVWAIADGMPNASRKEVLKACVAQGINVATASTQYSKWKKAQSE